MTDYVGDYPSEKVLLLFVLNATGLGFGSTSLMTKLLGCLDSRQVRPFVISLRVVGRKHAFNISHLVLPEDTVPQRNIYKYYFIIIFCFYVFSLSFINVRGDR